MTDSPLISVVIPTYNEAATIGAAVGQFDALSGRWEIIVADSGSPDRTVEIARETGRARVVSGPPGRGAGMNAGAERASGDVLLFLHADTRLPSDAYHLIADALRDSEAAATAFRLRMDRTEWRFRVLSLVSRIRVRVQRTFFGDQAIAVRRRDFERIGGYHESTLMEDVDLSRRLRRLGELRVLPADVVTSARRFEQGGVFRTLVLMTLFQVAYRLGVPADRLARRYAQVRAGTTGEERKREKSQVALGNLVFVDEAEKRTSPSSWQGSPVLLVFLRWLG